MKIFSPIRIVLCLLVLSGVAAPAESLSLRLADKGINISAGGLGQFILNYPVLVGERWDQVRKPIEKSITGNRAIIKFDAGAQVGVELQPATGELILTPMHLPAEVKTLRCEMLIDFNFASGGSWKIGESGETPFPPEKPAKPHLYQGHAESMRLKDFQGATLTLTAPPYSFQQLTDNREWGWKTFAWQFEVPCSAATGPLHVKIAFTGADAAKIKPLVDKFGQNTRVDYPDKVKTEAELKADVLAEAIYLASLHPPALDTYGGLPGSKERFSLKQTGYFHVEKKDSRWLLVDPAGNVFFHLALFVFIHHEARNWPWLDPHVFDREVSSRL